MEGVNKYQLSGTEGVSKYRNKQFDYIWILESTFERNAEYLPIIVSL